MSRRKSQLENLVVFTDGSCMRNGRVGAVGGIGIHFPDRELKDVSKVYKGTCTNQKTELYAILQALRYINSRLKISEYRIIVKTDSMYCINCITKWVEGWIDHNWVKRDGKPVANRELIEKIYKYYLKYFIIFDHVNAHTEKKDDDSIGNKIADMLAVRASKKAFAAANLKFSRNSGSKTNGNYQSSYPSRGSAKESRNRQSINSVQLVDSSRRKSKNDDTDYKMSSRRSVDAPKRKSKSTQKSKSRSRSTKNQEIIVELVGSRK